ncbi:endonuclease/exonuclease/phosphatase family protein [uncultured Photobacterium sp.]|uniref:endonuclease/exonuclease/phosphatase family protein n=1 Tax=uncultured Photobacterium sp. TaxID=173973 RepID=UPI00263A224F|nr:endonuclease/exonuclease/phosphatase family protein [uncultured Photobacterium sp.]
MQWLSLKQTSPVKRSAADYNALRQLFTTYSPDILAFQEVDSAEALYRVIDKTQYKIYLSDRIHNPQDNFKKNNQYTGFAIKRQIVVNDVTDLSQLSSPAIATGIAMPFKNKLRYGSIIEIVINQQSILLLNLHLKSGCFTEEQLSKQKSKACKTLAQQLTLIKQWVNTQQQVSQPFIIVGDINHQIVDNRQFINRITDNSTKATLLSASINAHCTVKLATQKPRYRTYRKLIDHLVATTNISALSQHQIQYNKQQLLQFTLSDHCPLLFTLSIDPIISI